MREDTRKVTRSTFAHDDTPHAPAHTCPREHRDVTRKCRCAAFGGVAHTHRTGDGIIPTASATPCDRMHTDAPCALCDANTRTYRATIARINARQSHDPNVSMLRV
jgi:hypothetical protein